MALGVPREHRFSSFSVLEFRDPGEHRRRPEEDRGSAARTRPEPVAPSLTLVVPAPGLLPLPLRVWTGEILDTCSGRWWTHFRRRIALKKERSDAVERGV